MEQIKLRYQTCELDNALRVIVLRHSSPVVYCGYEINAGTSLEQEGEEGLAHFCEHVTFKGTRHRSALDIINCLESVGGELNAYTTKTATVYYAALLKEHLGRAVDVLSDMVFGSVYPQKEIDKEVEVICDEIESYHDSPAELIYDDFENLIFQGTPLGHNILGKAERVRQFTTADALRFTRAHYTPQDSVFFAYGDVNFDELVRLLCETLHTSPRGAVTTSETPHQSSYIALPPCTYEGQTIIQHRHTHQAHVMLGCRGFSVFHPDRIALYLLNNILGGPGMNARLNLSLRERNALVYTVESTMISYAHTGLWCVYFGCDAHDVERCLELVKAELQRFINTPLTSEELAAAKKQIKGQIGIACDNRENFALDFGKSFLHYGWEKDITKLFHEIDAVTSEQIQGVATHLFRPERLTTLQYVY